LGWKAPGRPNPFISGAKWDDKFIWRQDGGGRERHILPLSDNREGAIYSGSANLAEYSVLTKPTGAALGRPF
jgi:hypothetical protein